jgi:hypothetical protein
MTQATRHGIEEAMKKFGQKPHEQKLEDRSAFSLLPLEQDSLGRIWMEREHHRIDRVASLSNRFEGAWNN